MSQQQVIPTKGIDASRGAPCEAERPASRQIWSPPTSRPSACCSCNGGRVPGQRCIERHALGPLPGESNRWMLRWRLQRRRQDLKKSRNERSTTGLQGPLMKCALHSCCAQGSSQRSAGLDRMPETGRRAGGIMDPIPWILSLLSTRQLRLLLLKVLHLHPSAAQQVPAQSACVGITTAPHHTICDASTSGT